MDKGNLKVIIKDIEVLLETLKSLKFIPMWKHIRVVRNFDDPAENYISDYDEIFDDDDGYPD